MFSIIGCGDSASTCCTIIDNAVSIRYINQEGQNLFSNSLEYDESYIRIYYKNNNEFEYVYKGNLDHPNMHHVFKNDLGESVLMVFPSDYYDGNFSTTLIELNENVIDTLLCEFKLESNISAVKNVWLNGVDMKSRDFISVK